MKPKIMKWIRTIIYILGVILFIMYLSGDISGNYVILTWIIILFGFPLLNAILMWKYVKPLMWNLVYHLSEIIYKKPLDIPIEKRMYPMGDDEHDNNKTGHKKQKRSLKTSKEGKKR